MLLKLKMRIFRIDSQSIPVLAENKINLKLLGAQKLVPLGYNTIFIKNSRFTSEQSAISSNLW